MSATRWRYVAAPLAVVIVVGMTAEPASAQSAGSPVAPRPQWVVSIGGASMHPLHGDDEPEGPVVAASLGFTDNRRVRIEAEVTRRARSTSYGDDDVFLYGGPTGVNGRAARIDGGRDTTDWTAGVNLLGRTGGRRLSVFGGPGAVFHHEQARQYRVVTNCTPPSPGSGAECRSFDDRSSRQGLGLQLLAGIDLAVHARLTAFAAGRGEYRRGLALGSVGVMAGVRVGVR